MLTEVRRVDVRTVKIADRGSEYYGSRSEIKRGYVSVEVKILKTESLRTLP